MTKIPPDFLPTNGDVSLLYVQIHTNIEQDILKLKREFENGLEIYQSYYLVRQLIVRIGVNKCRVNLGLCIMQ